MNRSKKEKLKNAGYRITDTKEFLHLSDAEASLIELKITLMERLRKIRTEKKISQSELAKRVGSSQSRIAKIEAAASDVTLDLIIKALFVLGENPKKLGKALARAV